MLLEEIDRALSRLQGLNSVQIRSIAVAVVQALEPPLLPEDDLFAEAIAIRDESLRKAEELARQPVVGELLYPVPAEPEIIDGEFVEVVPSLPVASAVIEESVTAPPSRTPELPRLSPRLQQTLEY